MAAKNELKENAGWFLAMGVLMILFGFTIIIFPVAGTFTVELLFGLLLLIAGITEVVLSFRVRGWGGFFLLLMMGIFSLVVGLTLLMFPIQGVITLTLLLGLFLAATGLLKIIFSFTMKGVDEWGWVLFNGIISVLLGVLIIGAWPSDAAWVIGLLFGIDMVFGGLTSLMFYSAAKE
jgi:uncharacterized membrane protein HdeD (DUF308 family)